MSLEAILNRIRDAFDMLNRREFGSTDRPAPAPRPRITDVPDPAPDAPVLEKVGFAEEALPWMDAVHRFSLRLTQGDEDAAADLVQDTFLKAYRAWQSFQRGTNCKSWLFTICKNTHLKNTDQASTRREVVQSDLDANIEAMAVVDLHDRARHHKLGIDLFDHAIDDRVIAAIDGLPDEFRDVLVLSDLGDLKQAEISHVLGIPAGTVKSRLFRARRRLQEVLIDHAADVGITTDQPA